MSDSKMTQAAQARVSLQNTKAAAMTKVALANNQNAIASLQAARTKAAVALLKDAAKAGRPAKLRPVRRQA